MEEDISISFIVECALDGGRENMKGVIRRFCRTNDY